MPDTASTTDVGLSARHTRSTMLIPAAPLRRAVPHLSGRHELYRSRPVSVQRHQLPPAPSAAPMGDAAKRMVRPALRTATVARPTVSTASVPTASPSAATRNAIQPPRAAPGIPAATVRRCAAVSVVLTGWFAVANNAVASRVATASVASGIFAVAVNSAAARRTKPAAAARVATRMPPASMGVAASNLWQPVLLGSSRMLRGEQRPVLRWCYMFQRLGNGAASHDRPRE